MTTKNLFSLEVLFGLACLAGFVLTVLFGNYIAAAFAAVALIVLLRHWFDGWRASRPDEGGPSVESRPHHGRRRTVAKTPENSAAYVDHLIEHGRQLLLLRPKIIDSLTDAQRQRAVELTDQEMSLVSDGNVAMSQPKGKSGPSKFENVVTVDEFLLDRFLVTNGDYQLFVDAGGYDDPQLWDDEISGSVSEFLDQTGCTGPRYWSEGQFPAGMADHPVVGVSWYEAQAYSRWVGKHLPSDPQWVRAAAWPVANGSKALQQRKYPWGGSMDEDRANLYTTGPGTTVSVTEFAGGVSVGGIRQMIGNVWEWTTSDFGQWLEERERLEFSDSLKSLRGGAFDTYFENHAVCHFQSGENLLARKRNVGFRCAVESRLLAKDVSKCLAGGNPHSGVSTLAGCAS